MTITSKVVYAIYDEDSDLFVTKGQPRLEELGIHTLLFETKSEAMRRIESKPSFEFRDCSKTTRLQNDLAWWLLEQLYKTDRWHIACSIEEFNDAVSQFNHLKAVEVEMNYKGS